MKPSAPIRCVQPGERGLFRLERAFGRLRRWYLRGFRRGYIARMAELRQGECPACPHEIVDGRDLKLYRNVCGFRFPPGTDRFAWRGRLPFARQGLVEVTVVGVGGALLAVGLLFVAPWFALAPALVASFYFWFFRDPHRTVPTTPDIVVAPCDGVVDDICEVEHCTLLDGPATRVGISLSLFNVHVNRAPVDATIQAVHYFPGVFENAMRKGDHGNNEQFWTVFAPSDGAPRLAVRQIAGPMARTIVNEVRTGQVVARGERFGMIKFGSRTELYLPRDVDYEITARLGQRVRGGVSGLLLRRRKLPATPSTPTPTDAVDLGAARMDLAGD